MKTQHFSWFTARRARTLELDNSLVAVTKRLLEVERRLVMEHLSPERRQELELILAERERLEGPYPGSAEEPGRL